MTDLKRNKSQPDSPPKGSMKAIFIEKFGLETIVKDIPIPTPKEGEVLIRVEAAPINPLDLAFMKGASERKPRLPCQLGYEGAGLVVSSGGGSYAKSLVGKRVCFFSPPGMPSTWAQYIVTPAFGCFQLAPSISYDIGASGIINPVTAVAFLDIVKEEKHKAVVQTAAASQLGRMMVKLFKKEGIPTINIVRKNEQKKILEELGADVVLNSEDPNFEQELKKKAEELGATICLECICGDVTAKVVRAMPKESVTYIYGHLATDALTGIDFANLLVKNKTIKTFMFVRWMKAQGAKNFEIMQRIQELLQDELKSDIAKTVSLKDVKEAIRVYTQNMTVGKVIIKPHL